MSDPFRLDGKRAVVTGAGKGIGRGIALQLARAGADLVISSRTQEDLDSLAIEVEALGQQATKVVVDVTNTAEVEDLAAQAVAEGGIDVWVNNADHRRHLPSQSQVSTLLSQLSAVRWQDLEEAI